MPGVDQVRTFLTRVGPFGHILAGAILSYPERMCLCLSHTALLPFDVVLIPKSTTGKSQPVHISVEIGLELPPSATESDDIDGTFSYGNVQSDLSKLSGRAFDSLASIG